MILVYRGKVFIEAPEEVVRETPAYFRMRSKEQPTMLVVAHKRVLDEGLEEYVWSVARVNDEEAKRG